MFTFPKQEKLCGQLRIAALYKHGKRFTAYPLRVTYLQVDETKNNLQVLIWAPKSIFKRANKRNRLRRLIREAYRLNATEIREKCQVENIHLQIAFNYIAPEEMNYHQIEKAMQKALHSIEKKVGK